MKPIEPTLKTDEQRVLLQRFRQGEIHRRDVQSQLREFDNGVLLQLIIETELHPPRLSRQDLEDHVDPLPGVLGPWMTPSKTSAQATAV